MDKTKITEPMREQLRKPFPAEAITKHPTKSFLSTIKAIYVTERLSDVFGIGRWDFITEVAERTPDYVLVKGVLRILDYEVTVPAQYGGHKTTGTNTEIADGFKSSITDALSKSASYLEIGIDVFKGLVKTSPGKNPTHNRPYEPKLPSKKPGRQMANPAPELKRLTALKAAEPVLYNKACADKNIDPAKVMTPPEVKEVLSRATALWKVKQAQVCKRG